MEIKYNRTCGKCEGYGIVYQWNGLDDQDVIPCDNCEEGSYKALLDSHLTCLV